MVHIDGSDGEGGGQIVRSALTLSLVTGIPTTIENVRARRKRPGLMRQHLAAVLAAQKISQAELEGAEIGSRKLVFRPGPVQNGEYDFRIGSAGSATLVLQTVLPAMVHGQGETRLSIEGGTHNPMAPPFEFLTHVYLPLIKKMRADVSCSLVRHGFYPAGGGRIEAKVSRSRFGGLELMDRGPLKYRRVTALVARLPPHIAHRECDTIRLESGWNRDAAFAVQEISDSAGPGNVVIVQLEYENVSEVISGFGKKGVPAERVAKQTWRAAQSYLESDVPVGTHLADQLLLPMGLAAHFSGAASQFRTMPLSQHAQTHIAVLQRFLEIKVFVEQESNGTTVQIGPLVN